MQQPSQGNSLWLSTTPAPEFPPLRGDISVDVAIVGGGITGLTAAALLAEAGRRVAVLEAGRLGGGVTGHTTAHLDWATDAGPAKLLSQYGERGAKLTLRAGLRAIDRIAEWTTRHGIACEFKRTSGYYFTESESGLKGLEQNAQAARSLAVSAELVRQVPLPFAAVGAVRYRNAGRFHPLRYLYGLADAIAGDRCQIYEQTRVIGLDEGTPCRLETERGRVQARKVVLATHSPLGLRFSIHTRVAPYRSYVIGVRVAEPFPEGIFFDDANPYHYLRRLSDEDDRLVLVGGADHKTGQRDDTEACYTELEDYARQRLGVQGVEHRWSAQVFVPVDDLPLIGLDVMSKHTYVATGFAGNGMTFGTYAGMLIADLIVGRDNPAAELFSPRRANPVASARRFISENLNVARHDVTDWLSPGHGEDFESLMPGEGRIYDAGGRKMAVYRDGAGRVYKLSAACTHAKCVVRWNPAERSWDCPCHGSRYRATGEVIEGPAMRGLEPIEIVEQVKEEG